MYRVSSWVARSMACRRWDWDESNVKYQLSNDVKFDVYYRFESRLRGRIDPDILRQGPSPTAIDNELAFYIHEFQ